MINQNNHQTFSRLLWSAVNLTSAGSGEMLQLE